MNKSKMLKAIEYNWGMMGPNDWNRTKWEVYYDGSYKITIYFNPSFDEMMEDIRKEKIKRISGTLGEKEFKELKTHLDSKQWIDPQIDNRGTCDGTAWEIEYYDVSGKLLNSSKLGYIYGHECLEKIASCLPETDEMYDAPAYVSVR